jgi:hypothetical protein
VFVIDLKPDPCDPAPVDSFVDDLVERVIERAPERAILVKVDVYDAAFESPAGRRRPGRRCAASLPEHRPSDRFCQRLPEGSGGRRDHQPRSGRSVTWATTAAQSAVRRSTRLRTPTRV